MFRHYITEAAPLRPEVRCPTGEKRGRGTKILAFPPGDGIMNLDNKKCGSLRVLVTPASLSRWVSTYKRPFGRAALPLYGLFPLFARGRMAVLWQCGNAFWA